MEDTQKAIALKMHVHCKGYEKVIIQIKKYVTGLLKVKSVVSKEHKKQKGQSEFLDEIDRAINNHRAFLQKIGKL